VHPILFEIPNRATLSTGVLAVEVVVGILCLLGWLALRARAPAGWAATTLSTVAILVGLHFALSWFMKGQTIKIYTFGVVIILGFLAGVRFLSKQTDRLGFPQQRIFDWAFWLLLTGIIGSRLLYGFLNPEQFQHTLEIFAVWNGGLVWYGGLIPAVIVGVLLLVRWKLPVLTICDACASSLMLALGIGRWACFLAGDDYGQPTTLWQGVRFYADSLVVKGAPALEGVPLHPTQMYMSVNALWLFFFLELIRRRSKYAGQTFASLLILYALTRAILIEPVRGDFVERNPSWRNHLAAELLLKRTDTKSTLTIARGTEVSGGGRAGKVLGGGWPEGVVFKKDGSQAPETITLAPGQERARCWVVSDQPVPLAERNAMHSFRWPIDKIAGVEGVTVDVQNVRFYNSDLPKPPGFVSTSQWISIGVVLGGVLIFWIARKLRQPGFRDAVQAYAASQAAA
jgi:phosphatidylglycerol:prolipoprotein diacylglycerol transferase